ncbi:hypothetical protein L6304_02825 [bacterium]|nr:hypothetical protein [bacterium]
MEMERKEEVICPNCGRFVGAHMACPYCGTKVPKRMSVMLFKYGALAVAFLGLIFLYLAVRVIKIPVVKVKDITETMNFAYIRVIGTVEGANVTEWGALYLTVDDGTGSISAKAYGKVAEEIMRAERPPKIKDRIDVGGTLNITEGKRSLTIQTTDRVKVVPREEWMGKIPAFKIGDITRSKIGELARCQGAITNIRTFTKGRTLTIDDGSGSIDVLIWDADYEKISNKGALQIGREVSVQGVIGSFRDKLQIKPGSPEEIKIVGAKEEITVAPSVVAPPAAVEIPILNIGQITKDRIGQTVGCQGVVTQYKPFAKGAMLVVSDETGRIVVVLWDDVKNQITDNRVYITGTKISVRGKLGAYREQLQLVPHRASDITVKGG